MKGFFLNVFFCFYVIFSGTAQKNVATENLVFKKYLPAIQGRERLASTELNKYDVKSYILDVEVDNQSTQIAGNGIVVSKVVSDELSEFYLELANHLFIDSVRIGSELVVFTHENDLLIIPLQSIPGIGTLLEVQVYYHGIVPQGGFFTGMTNGEDGNWNQKVTWTLSEPYAAKDWFPCKQDLLDKADSVKVSITTKEGLKAGSNGLLKSVESLPGQKVKYNWETFYPTAYYLISISVADYMDYSIYAHPEGHDDSILIQNYIYNSPGYLTQKYQEINETAELIELYSELFTMYPFESEKYGHCVAPMGGGMEHQTMTTLSSFTYYLVAHELGHQWFGDNVTCATWQDIWINEGFASYTEYLAMQMLRSQEEADTWMGEAQRYAKQKPQGSVYIPFEELNNVNRIFDYRLSYKKGASIIHMLRFELNNDSLFFNTLKEFQTKYTDSVATGLDFRELIEEQSGMDFTAFFDQWYFGQGYPFYNITWRQSNDTLVIESTQTTSSSQTPLFKMPLEFKIQMGEKDTIIRVHQKTNLDVFQVKLPGVVSSIMLDPDAWSLLDLNSISKVEDPYDDPSPFLIYPNPATDYLILDFNGISKDRQIRILDVAGRKIQDYKSDQSNIRIDTYELSQGIYIIQVTEDNLEWTQKFLKK